MTATSWYFALPIRKTQGPLPSTSVGNYSKLAEVSRLLFCIHNSAQSTDVQTLAARLTVSIIIN
jgi:hypothetical protein